VLNAVDPKMCKTIMEQLKQYDEMKNKRLLTGISTDGEAFKDSQYAWWPFHSTQKVVFHIQSHDCEEIEVEFLADGHKVGTSGKMPEKSFRKVEYELREFAGKNVKHCRWRPGLGGFSGTGGGDANWCCPNEGYIEVYLQLHES